MSKFAAIFLNSIKVSGFRFYRCVVCSKVKCLTVDGYLSAVSCVGAIVVNATWQVTVFGSWLITTIRPILRVSCFTKIRNTVIRFASVDMVNKFRPFPIHIEPCQSVGKISVGQYAEPQISSTMTKASNGSGKPCIPLRVVLPIQPSKQSSIRVVMQETFKLGLSKIWVRHSDYLRSCKCLGGRVQTHPVAEV